ncbi:MAG: DUF2085 domain-containing protein [Chloroflexi bacterium]|nr:DUF2085 domain-containing protein [Chloroflexota bacterium]
MAVYPRGSEAHAGSALETQAVTLAAGLRAHWLALVNAALTLFVALPLAAPWLMSVGRDDLASWVYRLYATACHQWSFRTFFLFGPRPTYSYDELSALAPGAAYSLVGSPELGYKVAFCERDVAIYTGALLAGLLFIALRSKLRPLRWSLFMALIVPMALDGLTQLLGLRESNVELRTLTGLLFGIVSVWLVFPRLDLLLTGRPPTNERAVAVDGLPA